MEPIDLIAVEYMCSTVRATEMALEGLRLNLQGDEDKLLRQAQKHLAEAIEYMEEILNDD